MDVAIISYRDCLFSQSVVEKIKDMLEGIATPDGLKIHIIAQSYDLRDLDHHSVAAEVHRAKVQILVLSNYFLEKLRQEASTTNKLSLNRALRSKRVIAVLTGISTSDFLKPDQAPVLARYNEFFTLEHRAASKEWMEEEFRKKFADQVLKIYNVELSNNRNFSVFPQKATRDQPKILIMFKNPLGNDDTLKVEFARGADKTVLNNVVTTNPYTTIVRIPESLCADKTSLLELTIFINKQKLGTKLVKYEFQAKAREEDIINKMCKAVPGFQKLLDDHISQTLLKNFRACTDWSLDPDLELMNDVLVSKGDDFPTLMHFSAFYGLEQTVFTVLDEADGFEQCRVMNDVNETPRDIAQGNVAQIINDYQEMAMSCKAFQFVKDLVARNSDSSGKIFQLDESTSQVFPNSNSYENGFDEETLNKLGEILTENSHNNIYANVTLDPYVNSKSELKRKPSYPPSVKQRRNPRRNSKNFPQNYVNVYPEEVLGTDPEPPSLPSKPLLTPTVNQKLSESCDFPREEAYEVPPSGVRPVNPSKTISTVITAQPGRPVRPDSSGYLPMDPPENVDKLDKPLDNIISGILPFDQPVYPHMPLTGTLGPVPPTPIKLDPADEDLIEIMNDFKNNVYSMRQLELLFEHWKRRTDVKMSYQERQERLKHMRTEYNQIQERMTGQRRPSVLHKVLQFFITGKKKTSSTSGSNSRRVPERSTSEPELPIKKAAADQSLRKTSNNSDRVSNGSGHSPGISDTESSTAFKDTPVPYVNALGRKCVVSYVEPHFIKPADTALTSVSENPKQNPHYKEPPPPRPVKSKMLANPQESPVTGGSPPPRSPKPGPKKGMKDVLPPEKVSSPPVPPRRAEKTTPFRFIQYEKRLPDGSLLLEKKLEPSWSPSVSNGTAPTMPPYQNDIASGQR